MTTMHKIGFLALAIFLASCGGGGDGGMTMAVPHTGGRRWRRRLRQVGALSGAAFAGAGAGEDQRRARRCAPVWRHRLRCRSCPEMERQTGRSGCRAFRGHGCQRLLFTHELPKACRPATGLKPPAMAETRARTSQSGRQIDGRSHRGVAEEPGPLLEHHEHPLPGLRHRLRTQSERAVRASFYWTQSLRNSKLTRARPSLGGLRASSPQEALQHSPAARQSPSLRGGAISCRPIGRSLMPTQPGTQARCRRAGSRPG